MKYRLKWIKENLGITRSAIRYYEEKGLLPRNTYKQDREYSEDEVEGLWAIQILKGMGYSIDDIIAMRDNPDFDFQESLGEKIREMEQEVKEKERHINYAKTIKLLGRFPSRPKEMGSVTAKEFCERSVKKWNVQEDPETKRYQEIAELVLRGTDEELQESEYGKLFSLLNEVSLPELFQESNQVIGTFLYQVVKKRELGSSHVEVQLLIKMIYEEVSRLIETETEKPTPQQFARYYGTSFIAGDIKLINEMTYGKEGCDFIADAIAVFGGYIGKDEIA